MRTINQITGIRAMFIGVCGRASQGKYLPARCGLVSFAGLSLAAAVLWLSGPTACLYAQATIYTNSPSQEQGIMQAASLTGRADHTITLTKMVEIYEFEGLKVAVDQYEINQGDSLVKVLQNRGLIKSNLDQGKMLRLVKDLNPELDSVNTLMPGQVIKVPSLLTPNQVEIAERVGAPAEPQAGQTALNDGSGMITETLKEYQRPASSQQPARVKVYQNRFKDKHLLAQNVDPGSQSVLTDASPINNPPQPESPAAAVGLAAAQNEGSAVGGGPVREINP